MRVTLIGTEGRGGAAEIRLDDQLLRVVDAISPPERAAAPGPLADARLEVVVIPHLTGPTPPDARASGRFEADHGWRYRAHGVIVSTSPLRAAIGSLELTLEHHDGDAWAVGDAVSVAIDRIVLTRGPAPQRIR